MKYYLSLLLWILTVTISTAQLEVPVKWTMSSKHLEGNEYLLEFKASIDDGWVIYSQYLESDDGPVATAFYYDEGEHFSLKGKNVESGNKKEGYEKLFQMNLVKFYKKAIFSQKVTLENPGQPITGYLEYMTCNDLKCLPPSEVDFTFELEAPQKEEKIVAPAEGSTQVEEEVAAPAIIEAPAPKTASDNIAITSKTTTASDYASQETQDVSEEDAATEAVPLSFEVTSAEAPASLDDGLVTPVQWTFSKKELGNQEYELIFQANLKEGWQIYSHYTDDSGPIPTSMFFEEGSHFSIMGKLQEEGKKEEGLDPYFGIQVIKFKKGPVLFKQRIQLTEENKAITGYIEYMSCDDSKCIPLEEEFRFDFGRSSPIATASSIKIEGNQIDQSIASIQATRKEPIGNCGKEEVASGGLFWTFLLGFAGGLLALLTPCVFPMIPLTVSFFTKGSEDRKKGIQNALIYGLSIIVIYVTIGLLLTSLFGATALNQLATSWEANTLFFIIFILFAFSFFGYYEITLPSSWMNKSDEMADKGGLLGIFFMAFTLALVSFSCTGPIIGSAIVQSATDAMGPFIVMLGFSTALALPFGLFAAFPAWLNSLPKSGGWMNSVKVVLGFLELALALKFLSVADMTMHWNILPYEVFMGLWVLIFGAMTLYLFGFIRFPHDSKVQKLSLPRWGFALASIAATIYLATGFTYNSKVQTYNALSLMSGIAPPAMYNWFLPDPKLDADIKARYASYTKCANNLDCFKDYEEGVAYAREVSKPILLDFTGYGCVNCRKTEEHIWIKPQIWSKIQNDFVLISLYVDDRKPLDKILISKNTNEKLRNVGRKWSDFQIVNFQQNSQPLYIMLSPEEKVLAAPRGYKEGASDYADFLSCGLSTFQRMGLK